MRVLIINSVCGIGSTGRICVDLAHEFEKQGHEVKIAYGRTNTVSHDSKCYAMRIGNLFEITLHGIKSRLIDAHGLGSKHSTKRFLRWAESYAPDVLWLHNIHGYYINYELLFAWIKMHPEMDVKWTLHDCWAFTGHCSHFQVVGCNRWKTVCCKCPQTRQYPTSLFMDNSMRNYRRKQVAFMGVKNLTLITPSRWLANLVKQSFLKEYPVEVQYNRVDTGVFKPTKSSFRKDFGLCGKIIVLGVSSVWNNRKGLDDFLALSRLLDNRFRIVLVGLSKKQIRKMPLSILALPRVSDVRDLAGIYSEADVFVNPSREETFGLTSYEAALCGARVIVYRGTACEEIANLYNGVVVEPNVNSLFDAITNLVYNDCVLELDNEE